MILRGWRIEGFGRFHDVEVQGLGPGLTVIEGPNEAGKSTLLGFLRFMLFGFARGQAQKYPPLSGGRHGGRLYLEDQGGEWQLERLQGRPLRLIAPDGSVQGEDALQGMLGRIDGAIFRDVFAFSLWELSNLEALSQEEVRDRLYSVGLTGAGRSASAARRALEQRLEELLRPRSQESRINRLLADLLQVRERLREAQLQAQDFSDLVRQEALAEEGAQRLRAEERALRGRQDALLLLRTLEGLWHRLARLEEEFGRPLPEIDAALAEEAEALLSGLQARAQQIEEREGEERELLTRIEALTPREELLRDAVAVEEAVRGVPLLKERRRRLEELQAAIARRRAERAEVAASLNLAQEGPVPLLDFGLLQEIDAWVARLEASEAQALRLREEAEEAVRDAALAQQDEEAARALFAPYEGALGAQALEARIAAISSLQRSLDRMHQRRGTLALLLAIGAALALAGALGLAANLLYLAAPLALGVALLLYAGLGGPARTLRAAREDAKAAADEAKIVFPPPERDLERVRREAEAERASAAERERLAQRLQEAALVSTRRQAAAVAAQEASRAAQELERAEQEASAEFKRRQGLPEGLSPQRLASYAAQLQTLARVQAELAEGEAEAAALQGAIGAWREAAQDQLRRAGREVPAEEGALLQAALALGEDVHRARSALGQVQELGIQRNAVRARLQDAREHQEGAQARVQEILRQLGAADAAQLRILREAAELRAQFRDQAGAAAEEIAAELRQGDTAARREEEEDISARLERLETQREESLRRAQDLRRQRERVAQTADVAEYAAQEERIHTDLQRAVEAWRAVYAGKRLLERTLEVYERDRQPEVLRLASEALLQITGGRYIAVRQRSDEKGLTAIAASGEQRAPEELSRGTAEQLYLALRLGLAASYGERVASLPLVLDDVLVNFDPQRAKAVLSVLAQFAGAPGRQALLFTCHPFVREMAQALPGTRTLHLDGPSGEREAAAASGGDAVPSVETTEEEILVLLAGGEKPLRAIAEALGRPEAAVRRELDALSRAGKVEAIGERRARRYRLAGSGGLFGV